MIAHGELNKAQFKTLRDELAKLDLPPKKRQRFLWRMAKYGVMAAAKRNVRNQQSPDGQKWAGRKTKRKGKMLRNMPKLLHIREMPQLQAVRLYLSGGGYRNGAKPVPAGVIGYSQQNGMSVTINRRQVAKNQAQGNQPAPVKQAKRLRKLGYKVRHGKRWKKLGYKEIAALLTKAKAGAIIRSMEGKPAKTSWTVDVPARQFIGMSDDDFYKALARQLQAIGFGADVNAQNIRGSA